MVTVSVRTGPLPRRPAEALGDVPADVARSAGPLEGRQRHARDQDRPEGDADRLHEERPRGPRREAGQRRRPARPSGSSVSPAADMRALPIPRSRLATTMGSRRVDGGVGEHLGSAQQKHGDQDDGDVDVSRRDRHGQDHERSRPSRVHGQRRAGGGRSGQRAPRRTGRTTATAARWSRPAIATRSGSDVCEATSSGPTASAIPSPRLATQAEPTSQRNVVPMRAGRKASSTLLTRRAPYETLTPRSADSPLSMPGSGEPQDPRLPRAQRVPGSGRLPSTSSAVQRLRQQVGQRSAAPSSRCRRRAVSCRRACG